MDRLPIQNFSQWIKLAIPNLHISREFSPLLTKFSPIEQMEQIKSKNARHIVEMSSRLNEMEFLNIQKCAACCGVVGRESRLTNGNFEPNKFSSCCQAPEFRGIIDTLFTPFHSTEGFSTWMCHFACAKRYFHVSNIKTVCSMSIRAWKVSRAI